MHGVIPRDAARPRGDREMTNLSGCKTQALREGSGALDATTYATPTQRVTGLRLPAPAVPDWPGRRLWWPTNRWSAAC